MPPRSLHKREMTNSVTRGVKYTCSMSSRQRGGNLSYRFSPDPSGINIAPYANIKTIPTRGGQVSYATTRQIGPMEITGQLRSRWDLLELADFVQRSMSEAMYQGAPLRFVYPERDLDYDIYIITLTPGLSLDSSQAEIVEYAMSCAIVGQNSDVNSVPLSQLADIDLPADVGWIDTKNASEIAWRRAGDYAQISPPGEKDNKGGEDSPDGGTRGAAPPEERDVSNGGGGNNNGSGGGNGDDRNALERNRDEARRNRRENPWGVIRDAFNPFN